MKIEVTLKNWRISKLRKHTVVSGKVYNHPRFEDGTYIKSAPLVIPAPAEDGGRVESAQVIYNLEGK